MAVAELPEGAASTDVAARHASAPSVGVIAAAVSQSSAALLVAAVAVAVLLQGGFFARGQLAVGALLAASLLLAPTERRALGRLRVPVAAGVLLAAWALTRGAMTSSSAAGLREAGLILALGVPLLLPRSLDEAGRRLVLLGTLVVGTVVSMIGWAAVVFRITPQALPSAGLWRAASTLTYPNAMAAVLIPLALVAIALRGGRPRDVRLSVASMLLLFGAGVTLSRAGALALVVGLTVLVAAARGAALRAVAAPVAGAAIALVGLVPSLSTFHQSHPVLAIAFFAAGLAATVVATRSPRKGVAVVAVAAIVAIAAGQQAGLAQRAHHLWRHRANATSHARSSAAGSAVSLFRAHPLAGAGPGRFVERRTDHSGATHLMPFVHDEYLQILAEEGIVGGALLSAVLLGLAAALWHAPSRDSDRLFWAGVTAAMAAALVHAGFDFDWHIPAIPLMLATLIGLAVTAPPGRHLTPVIQRKEKA